MTSSRGPSLWGRVLTDGAELPPSRVEVDEGRIVGLEPAARPRADDMVVEEGWIAPGLIDIQVNGAGGVDLTSAQDPVAALAHVASVLVKHGVTSFCPTVISSRPDVITERIRAYRPRAIQSGAESLGIHVEGPFIDPDHRGVHDPRVLRPASKNEIASWLEVGVPAICTLAPERPGGMEAITQLVQAGALVSLGHSGADATIAQRALSEGARMATHLFNAMAPLHHRQPGLIGALLASNAALGLITDGVHIHPLVIDLVVRRCGTDRVTLVSDALASADMPPGEHPLGDQTVISDGRSVRRSDGTLAGSALLLDGCLSNVRAWLADVPPATLLKMCTQTPATLLGLSRKGRVAIGYDADLVVLDPKFNVKLTLFRGTCCEPA